MHGARLFQISYRRSGWPKKNRTSSPTRVRAGTSQPTRGSSSSGLSSSIRGVSPAYRRASPRRPIPREIAPAGSSRQRLAGQSLWNARPASVYSSTVSVSGSSSHKWGTPASTVDFHARAPIERRVAGDKTSAINLWHALEVIAVDRAFVTSRPGSSIDPARRHFGHRGRSSKRPQCWPP